MGICLGCCSPLCACKLWWHLYGHGCGGTASVRRSVGVRSCVGIRGAGSNPDRPNGLSGGAAPFRELLHEYDTAHFLKEDGTYDTTTNVTRITNTCLKYGLQLNNTLQTVNGFTLLPYDYLCPKDAETHVLTITENTYVIHHFDGLGYPRLIGLLLR